MGLVEVDRGWLALGLVVALGCGEPSLGGPGTTGTSESTAAPPVSDDSGDPGSTTQVGGSSSSPSEQSSSNGTSSESGGDGTSSGDLCTPPQAPEYAGMQIEVIAALSGAAELTPGVTIPGRWSNEQRGLARQYLADRLTAMGLEPTVAMYSAYGGNVAVLVPSTDGGDEYVIMGAHFDSEVGSPGAGDNATGVVMMLAAAEFAASLPCRSRNFVFVLFDEEEKGLMGSEAFVPTVVASQWNVHSVHTVDMISWDANDDLLVEIHRPAEGIFELYEAAVVEAGLPVLVVEVDDRSSDHTSFRDAGFPAVGLMEGWNHGDTTPHYHEPTDTADMVDYEYLHAATDLVLAVVASLARV